MNTQNNTFTIEALVYGRLPENMLSATQIIETLRPIIRDKHGAVLVQKETYRRIKKKMRYFALRMKKIYHVPMINGAICLGAKEEMAEDAVSQ